MRVASRPQAPQLVVGQDTVARRLRRRRLELVAGLGRDDAALDAQLHMLRRAARTRFAATGEPRSTMASSSSWTSARPMSARRRPRQGFTTSRSRMRFVLGCRLGLLVRLGVALDELVDDLLDEVAVVGAFVAGPGRLLRGGGVSALRHLDEDALRHLAGGLEVDAGIGAERVLAGRAGGVSVANGPRAST